MLKFLGTVAKGKATWTGVAVGVLSLLGKQDVAQQVIPITDAVLNVGLSVGGALAAFGVGRKGGYAAQPYR